MDITKLEVPSENSTLGYWAFYYAQLLYSQTQGNSQLPIDLLHLCDSKSISLKIEDFRCYMYADCVNSRGGKKVIALDEKLSSQRRRFYLAKGIGYHVLTNYVMGQQENYTFVEERDKRKMDITEKQRAFATLFALELLIPRQIVTKLRNEGKNILAIAVYFGVSVPMVESQINTMIRNPVPDPDPKD